MMIVQFVQNEVRTIYDMHIRDEKTGVRTAYIYLKNKT